MLRGLGGRSYVENDNRTLLEAAGELLAAGCLKL
jgi:hypothetical protein